MRGWIKLGYRVYRISYLCNGENNSSSVMVEIEVKYVGELL